MEQANSVGNTIIAHAIKNYGLPSTLKLSVHSGSDKFSIYPIIKKAIRINSSTPHSEQSDAGLTMGDMVMDERQKSPDELLGDHDILTHAMRLLDKLEVRESTVLRLRFGLDGEEPMTLKEIGEKLDLTRERVRQIESEALRSLAIGLDIDR